MDQKPHPSIEKQVNCVVCENSFMFPGNYKLGGHSTPLQVYPTHSDQKITKYICGFCLNRANEMRKNIKAEVNKNLVTDRVVSKFKQLYNLGETTNEEIRKSLITHLCTSEKIESGSKLLQINSFSNEVVETFFVKSRNMILGLSENGYIVDLISLVKNKPKCSKRNPNFQSSAKKVESQQPIPGGPRPIKSFWPTGKENVYHSHIQGGSPGLGKKK
jgi:hypothetical protein